MPGRAAVAGAALQRQGAGDGVLVVLGRLAEGLDARVIAAPAATAVLTLRSGLVEQVPVQGLRARGSVVRLLHAAAAALVAPLVCVVLAVRVVLGVLVVRAVLASDRDGRRAVGGAALQRRRERKRSLLVLRLLADRLDEDAAAALSLSRVLLERVQVESGGRRRDAVRLLDRAAAAFAGHADGRVRVRGAGLETQ